MDGLTSSLSRMSHSRREMFAQEGPPRGRSEVSWQPAGAKGPSCLACEVSMWVRIYLFATATFNIREMLTPVVGFEICDKETCT